MPQANYLTSKAQPHLTVGAGWGSIATEPIAAGETIAAYGGFVMTRDELEALPAERHGRSIQIDEHLFLVSGETPERGDMVNHSCQPNCGLSGANLVVALRDIEAGEELTFDYAMSDGSPYDEFECHCGHEACRGKVTGNDWMLPELQLRYRGYFSPYLARRISSLVSIGASRRAFAA